MSESIPTTGASSDGPPDQRPTNVRWWIFALSCATSWFLYLHRYTFAIIKPEIAKEFDVDLVQLGVLDSAFTVAYLGSQVPTGLIGDLFGVHFFLGGIIIAWSVTLALHAWAPSLGAMQGVRVLFGLTQAGAYPNLSKVTGAWFPLSIRTTLQGWIASFWGRFGGACANLLFASLLLGVLSVDWRTAIILVSAAGGLFGILFLIVFRNTPQEHPHANDAECRLIEYEEHATQSTPTGESTDQATPKTFRELLGAMSPRSIRNFGYLLIQQFSSTFADALYVAWIPFFLSVEHGLVYKEMGIYASLPLIGGAVGGMIGGYLNDWLIRTTGNRRWSRSAVGCVGKAMACVLIFVALTVYENPYTFCWVLLFVKLFGDWSQPTVWGTITDISGKASGTVFGINNGTGGLGGLLSPVVFGWVAMNYSWNVVFTVVGVTYLISSVAWLFVNCTIPLLSTDK